jgi:hypothetical protein
MHLYRKKNPNTLSIVVVDQNFCVSRVVDEPLQQFYIGKHRGSAQLPCAGMTVGEILHHQASSCWGHWRDIFWEFFLADLLEEFSPVQEYCLSPFVFLCVSKGRRLSEIILGGCSDDWFWSWRKF